MQLTAYYMVLILFWFSLSVVVYTLFVYPLLAILLAALANRQVHKSRINPKVTIIIAAYNEEKVIASKIDQTLRLNYPTEQMDILIASDGSVDRTDEIVRSFESRGVRLVRVEGRVGKTITLNAAATLAKGEIVVFSDATGEYNLDAIQELVSNFADPEVGCVSGRVSYCYGADAASDGFRLYQRLAVFIRRAEGLFGSQTSASGSIHAVRRELFRPTPARCSPDIFNPLHTVIAGKRVVYENNAIAIEGSRNNFREEFRARVRMGSRAASSTCAIVRLLLASKNAVYFWQMISHKLLRWYLWMFLLLVLISSSILALNCQVYIYALQVQVMLYLAAGFGIVAERMGVRFPLVSAISLFFIGNVAMAVGFAQCACGNTTGAWDTSRR